MTNNVIPDIPRIYTAIAEWWSCLIFVTLLNPHQKERKRIVLMAVALAVQVAFLQLTGNVTLWLWLPCMLIAFWSMTRFIYRCCKNTYWECVYYAVFAFVIAECMASLEWQIYNWIIGRIALNTWWFQGLLMIMVYGIIGITMRSLMKGQMPSDRCLDINRKDWYSAVFMGIVVFAVSNLSFLTKDVPFKGMYSHEIANIRTLVDIAGIAMLYAHWVLCCEHRTRMELEAVQNVLQNQYHQYKLSRESIDLINYKYHDLKHQIEVLRNEEDSEKRVAFLNQMEEDIKQYELQNKTGNHVLDTVLTSKSMYCNKHEIMLTCVVDGRLLEFMETMDICSIFGNALDNAAESVLKIPEKEKRMIHVTVSKQMNFLMICVENYYESSLEYEEGQLKTTKQDKRFHGYGIKSIQYIVNKYDGAVHIDTSDNWFSLKILIPLQNALE